MENRRTFLQQLHRRRRCRRARGQQRRLREENTRAAPRKFKLRYAPHFGMFKEHAGADPDRAARVHGRRRASWRSKTTASWAARWSCRQRIGETLARLGMTMGVFVIDGGDNWKTSLTTGKPEFREKFLDTCRTAVEVGKRVQRDAGPPWCPDTSNASCRSASRPAT